MANYTGTDWQPETKISTDIMATIDEGLGELNADLTDNYNVKTYVRLAQLGLSASAGCTMMDIIDAIRNLGLTYTHFEVMASTSQITDLPAGTGLLRISWGSSVEARYGAIEYFRTNGSNGAEYYIGQINTTMTALTWYQVPVTTVNSLNISPNDAEEDA